MKTRKSKTRFLSEEEIDRIVIAQADDDSAWGKPIKVRPPKSATMRLPSVLAARATFVARLHRESNVENWLRRIIQERISFEEAAFVDLKRDLTSKKRERNFARI
jgi:hypothetical protein